MYVDTFDLKGAKIPIRDSESRKIIEQVLGSISGTAGNSELPIYLENGVFKPCDNVLNVDILGEAQSAVTAMSADRATEANHANTATNASSADTATNATHASSADTATNATNASNAIVAGQLSTSAGSSSKPVYFSDGKPVKCSSPLSVDISGNANTATNATHASSADTATNATNATNATHASSADKVTLASVISSPFIRIPIDTANGTVYILTGSITLSVNTSIIYANSFIGAYTIPIPQAVRFPNGYYSIQLTCQADSKVVIPSLNTTTNLTQLQGYVQSDINSVTNVTFYVLCLGF